MFFDSAGTFPLMRAVLWYATYLDIILMPW